MMTIPRPSSSSALRTVRRISGVSFQLARPPATASWKLTPRANRTVTSRTVLSLAAALCVFLAAASCPAAELTLPQPDPQLLPGGPPSWNLHPGGAGLPEWRGRIDAGAPAIGFQTDMTFPDETIAVLGSGLDGADFLLWTEGMTFALPPLRTAEDRRRSWCPRELTRRSMGPPGRCRGR